MKKLICAVLALTLVLGMTACGGKKQEATEPAVEAPASALEVLQTVWNLYGDEEKFAVIGGDMGHPVSDGPGSYDLADENISYTLLIPGDQLKNVTEAASMIHMMNANTFTCGVFRLAEGVSAADFGKAMQEAVMGNQWMCGFPETLVIQNIADAYVLVAFGVNDAINPFMTYLTAAYPQSVNLVKESII